MSTIWTLSVRVTLSSGEVQEKGQVRDASGVRYSGTNAAEFAALIVTLPRLNSFLLDIGYGSSNPDPIDPNINDYVFRFSSLTSNGEFNVIGSNEELSEIDEVISNDLDGAVSDLNSDEAFTDFFEMTSPDEEEPSCPANTVCEDWDDLGEASNLLNRDNNWSLSDVSGTDETSLRVSKVSDDWGGTQAWYNGAVPGASDRYLSVYSTGTSLNATAELPITVGASGIIVVTGIHFLAWARFSNKPRWAGFGMWLDSDNTDNHISTVIDELATATTWYNSSNSPSKNTINKTFVTTPGSHTLKLGFHTLGGTPAISPPAGHSSGDRKNMNHAIDNLQISGAVPA